KGKQPNPVRFLQVGDKPSARGSSVKLTNAVTTGIWWTNTVTGDRVDLDLSVLGCDKDFNIVGQCSYTNLIGFNQTVKHSGDITNGANGVSEFIRFKLDEVRAKNPGLKYLVICCLSFNDVAF